jgi:wyosine [tRNA(Phe)-imidazoG37] synthetase (radical SAM superfamily)
MRIIYPLDIDTVQHIFHSLVLRFYVILALAVDGLSLNAGKKGMILGDYHYIFGPVPSRRMGLSLGVSPIPQKLCNYSCVYCQLGRTKTKRRRREAYCPVEEILTEANNYLMGNHPLDVVTIVGEGEPTLYLHVGELIKGLKSLTVKPIAVITNGSLLFEETVREELFEADIVLPSLDAYDEDTFKKINRPLGLLSFKQVFQGLKAFSDEFQGELWLETMLVRGLNDDDESLAQFKILLGKLNYDRLYLNIPLRPPAEPWVEAPTPESLEKAVALLKGTAIDRAITGGFSSEIEDDFTAVASIIKRHPMNQHEIKSFLEKRGCLDDHAVFRKLSRSPKVQIITYKDYKTYRGV